MFQTATAEERQFQMIGSYVFQEGTIVTPHEMKMLKTLHTQICQERNIAPDSPAAEQCAALLVALFGDGLNTEALLLDAVNNGP